MATTLSYQPRPAGRRVVRRARPALDAAYGTVLGDLPPEIHQAVLVYANAKRAEFEARSALSSELARCGGVKWREVDAAVSPLVYGS